MNALTWPSPAKLNLFLHITGRRADGYHELQTIFQFLDYCDVLSFSLRPDNKIQLVMQTTDGRPNEAIPVADNLVLRAAKLLQQTRQINLGADIILSKKIPIGGGLGGGSSNAATTLVALNKLWGLQLELENLLAMGLNLGADIPIFLAGTAAWAEGIGDKITPITLPEPWYVIITPPHPVSSAEIFSMPELTRNTRPITIQEFSQGKVITQNDCESVVKHRYPAIAQALDWLNQYAPARLTGTGSCVFAAMPTEQYARTVVSEVPAGWFAFAAKGLNQSPLLKVSSQ